MENNNAGYARRLLAVFIDILIYTLILAFPFYLLIRNVEKHFFVDPVISIANVITYIFAALLLGNVIFSLYSIYFTSRFGGTVGKLLAGIKIVNYDSENNIDTKTAFYRIFAGYAFSSVFMGYGYYKIIKSEENLAWHDRLFNTKVVKTNSLIPGIISFILLFALLTFLVISISTVAVNIFDYYSGSVDTQTQ